LKRDVRALDYAHNETKLSVLQRVHISVRGARLPGQVLRYSNR
jgi:hypothetical protein